MAEYFSRQLLKGQRADGEGRLPKVAKATPQYDPRRADWVGMRSGFLAKNWWLGKIRGSSISRQETLARIQGLLDTEFPRRRRSTPAELPAIAEARAHESKARARESKARTAVLMALASLIGAAAGYVGSLAAVG